MFIELHILQNFAPSNLNRDDTGAPKDCEFGGFRRARISSQCLKRAMRTYVSKNRLMSENELGQRSRLFTGKLVDGLTKRGHPAEQAQAVVDAALGSLKLQAKDGVSQYLLFFGNQELEAIAAACHDNWDTLIKVALPAEQAGGRREAKRAAQTAVPTEVKQALEAALQGVKAADVSMFGRMLADLPEHNVDAASQVAHALSTHRVTVDFDYYTAVDDLNPQGETGAGMIGTVEFNSACYYRYLNVDTRQLLDNMHGDRDLAKRALSAFLRAAVLALPGGKQNSTAAQSRPGLVLTVARAGAPVSLVNAFEKPVRADRREAETATDGARPDPDSITELSITRLARHFRDLNEMYGDRPEATALVTLHPDALDDGLRPSRVGGLDALLERTVESAFAEAVPA